MNKIYRYFLLLISVLYLNYNAPLYAQTTHAKPGMGEGKFNYTSFTPISIDTSAETINANKGYEQDPELGRLYKGAPCKDCYEAIGKRTERNKTFITKGKEGKEVLTQSSTAPMHYKSNDGLWHTIKTTLQPKNNGIYAATEQEAPVAVHTQERYSSFGKSGQQLAFNNDLELLFEHGNDSVTSLGKANWQNYTAGDDGVYVTNAWPGIDIEIRTSRGAVKTNFWINKAMPQYADGKLLVRDHLKMDKGLSLYAHDQKRFTGILEVQNEQKEKVYVISTATAFEKNDGEKTLRNLEYLIGDDNTLDIALPGDFLNRPTTSYPVIIDPLVTLGTSVAVAGSTYSPGWTVGCPIVDPSTVPADITITDIQFTFEYLASGGALQTNGAMDFTLGTCRNPALTGWYWYCLTFTPGTCGGANISLISDYGPCIPAVNCAAYDLNITMNFYQSYLSVAPCSNLYITATMPLTITVVGQSLHSTISNPAAICQGQSTTLNATTAYGSAPYSYSWSPGGATTSSISVAPSSTTVYTLITTDACGTMDTTFRTVTVNPNAPITGITDVCVGTTTPLLNGVPGGTWTSSNSSIATVDATGVVSGVSAGAATISYTTAAGCLSTIYVNVVTSPSPISGSSFLCNGASTSLTNTTTSGTWTSSNPSIATIDPAMGIVTGLSTGTVVITYAISAGCFSIFPMPVFPSPVISSITSSDPTSCISLDGSITLNGLIGGAIYTVDYLFNGTPVTANITTNGAGQVIITGLNGGTYTNIYVISSFGCVSNTVTGPFLLNFPPTPATPVVNNNGPICAGDVLNLTATCSTPGVTYSWTGPGGFISDLQNPVIAPTNTTNAGAYLVTATALGCPSSPSATVVVIHPLPFISNVSYTDPSVCFGADGTIILSGLISGVSYSVNYTSIAGPQTATIIADASGNVIISGLTSGTYSNINMSSFGCVSNSVGPVTLIDPGAPPMPIATSNAPVCEGSNLALFGTDSLANVTYLWNGPNGFTSTLQNPVVYSVTSAAAGNYMITISNGPCSTSSTLAVSISPGVTLFNVTTDVSVTLGTAVQLNASGAMYYTWTPENGTLNNPNINNPIARPIDKTTYIVSGMNEWGCKDTAMVTIDIEYTDTVLIPTAFTPNGDGHNDIFRIANVKNNKLLEFSIYNRWGQVVYNNTWDLHKGWDGTFNGVPADMGVYHYLIILSRPDGNNVVYKGDVTLIR